MITDEICGIRPFTPLRDNGGLNLAARISWLDVLPMIDEDWVWELPNRLLPREFPCPFCDRSHDATIYAETRDGGEWIHCAACGFAGDILEFAGSKLSLSPPEAARMLASKGLPIAKTTNLEDDLASYAHYLERRGRINEFWRQATRNVRDDESKEGNQILREFELMDDVRHPEWGERGGKYIGVASREELLRAFYPTRESNREWDVQPRFRGHWHTHVLVLPMHDLPGRLSGFLFFGLRGDQPAYVIRDVYSRAGRPISDDPGVWMFDVLGRPAGPEFPDGEMFFTNEPLDAYWLQVHHMRVYAKPLPLVLIPPAPSRPRAVWNFRRPRKPIFWSRRPDTAFFEQARELDARVALLPMNWDSFRKRCREMRMVGWLRHAAERATPWHASLAGTLLGSPSHEVERFLGKLPEDSRNDLFNKLDNRKRADLQQKLPPTLACRTLTYRGQIIAETPQGWQWRPRIGPPRIVLPGSLRVDEIIRTGRRRYLKGRLSLLDGGHVAYLVRDHAPNRTKTTQELVAQCEKEAQFPLYIEPSWRSRIWEIAMAFSKPVVAERRDRVGWDERRGMFTFPRFALRANGRFAENYPGLVLTAKTPCRNWEPFQTLSPAEISVLSQPGEDLAAVWAVLAVAIGNLLAPICNQPRPPLYLYGKGATAAIETLVFLLDLPVCRPRPDQMDSRR
ncbi:MAG TPA: hypothetical protein VHC22_16210 [Pirellulales bacterium]|nr:hypothetical protein [Pirellulales bacterium]